MSSSNCCFLTCIQVSQEAGQVVWYSHLFQNFPQFIVIHTVKGFGIVNKAEIDVFLELSCFFDDPMDVGNLISGFSAFSKSSLNIWKFSVHILLKPGLENFQHYFACMKVKVKSLSRVRLFATPWTVAHQAPPSMGFSRQEYWSGLPFPSPIMEYSVQFSLVAQSCPTLWDPMNRSSPGLPVHHHLPEFTQTHVHWVSDAIQPSHPLSSPSPPAPNPSQHQSLFQWVNSLHEVAKVLEFQL